MDEEDETEHNSFLILLNLRAKVIYWFMTGFQFLGNYLFWPTKFLYKFLRIKYYSLFTRPLEVAAWVLEDFGGQEGWDRASQCGMAPANPGSHHCTDSRGHPNFPSRDFPNCTAGWALGGAETDSNTALLPDRNISCQKQFPSSCISCLSSPFCRNQRGLHAGAGDALHQQSCSLIFIASLLPEKLF